LGVVKEHFFDKITLARSWVAILFISILLTFLPPPGNMGVREYQVQDPNNMAIALSDYSFRLCQVSLPRTTSEAYQNIPEL
jgi:hypothetical protein